MIAEHWKRIAGFHAEDDGTIGVVWLAKDPDTQVIYCYDAAIFRGAQLAVIADGITSRGRWIPVAWSKQDKEWADKLLELGANMTPEEVGDTQSMIEVTSNDIWQMLEASRFRVDKKVFQWAAEAANFTRDDKGHVPEKGFPLMSATRHAYRMSAYARPQTYANSKKANHPDIAVI